MSEVRVYHCAVDIGHEQYAVPAGDYVLASDYAKQIAQRDARIDELENKIGPQVAEVMATDKDRLHKLIAAERRIKELEARNEKNAQQHDEIVAGWMRSDAALQAKVERLEAALKFYADTMGQSKSQDRRIIIQDGGQRARSALYAQQGSAVPQKGDDHE